MEGVRRAGEVLRSPYERTIHSASGESLPDMRRRRDRHRVAVGRHATGLWYQERRNIEVGGDLQGPQAGVGPACREASAFGGDVLEAVLGHRAKRASSRSERLRRR